MCSGSFSSPLLHDLSVVSCLTGLDGTGGGLDSRRVVDIIKSVLVHCIDPRISVRTNYDACNSPYTVFIVVNYPQLQLFLH